MVYAASIRTDLDSL